jgi:thiol:disulfide interchange protein
MQGGTGARGTRTEQLVAAFVVYGVVVWWLAYRLRGSWRAVLPPLLGMLGVAMLGWLHLRLSEWSNGQIYLRVLQILLYPYGVMVGAVGLFIALIPKQPEGRRDRRCHKCLYDIRGVAVCPECGQQVLPPGHKP